MITEAVVILNCKRLYVTVLDRNNSVNIQKDVIFTLTSAVSMSCLDFAFLGFPWKLLWIEKRGGRHSFAVLLGTQKTNP